MEREERRADFRRADQLIVPQWIAVIILGGMVTYLFVTQPGRLRELESKVATLQSQLDERRAADIRIERKIDDLITLHMQGRVK